MDLALRAADQRRVRHAWQHGNAVAQRVICKVIEFIERDFARQRQSHDRLGVDVEFLNDGILDRSGKIGPDFIQVLPDVRRGDIHVDPEVELQERLAGVLHAGRGHVLQSIDGDHGVLDPAGYVGFDFARTGPGIDGDNRDVGNVQLGHQLQTQFAKRVDPEHR